MKRRLISLAAAGLAAGLVLAACGADDSVTETGLEDCLENPATCNSGEAADGGTITWAISQPSPGWNLISPSGGSVYALQMMAGIQPVLGWDDPAGEYIHNMDLLEEPPTLLEEDPWTFTFRFQDDAVWSDGVTPIDIDDVLVTWYMSTSPERGFCDECNSRSPTAQDIIASIEGSEDGKRVTVTYEEGNAAPEYFGAWGIQYISSGLYPAHMAETIGVDWQDPEQLGEYFEWLDETPPTDWSGGPYVMVEGDLEGTIIKEPNPNYYGDEYAPNLDTVIQRVLTDAGQYVSSFDNEELDGASPPDLDRDVIEQMRQRDDANLGIVHGPSWEHVDFNLENTWLEDVELRRAIFTAIDRDEIARRNFEDVFPEYQLRDHYLFRPDSDHYVDLLEGTTQGTGDIEEARSILEAAGYEGFEEGGTLTLDGEEVGSFRLRTTETEPRTTSVSLIQDWLSDIGITADIEIIGEGETLGGVLGEADYDIIQFGWSGSSNFFVNQPGQYGHSGNPNNFGSYDNPAYDELAELVQGAADLDEAAQYANEAFDLMVPDAYILPLYDSPVYLFVRDDYVNVRDNGFQSLRGMHNIWEWGVNADVVE